MENVNEINRRLAKNLIYYRKAAGLTQAELAEKINYSDKSVSKWEQGNGVPDIYILMQLASLYGITLNDLVGEEGEKIAIDTKRKNRGLHVLIMLLSCGIVWLVATSAFVLLQLICPSRVWWVAFLYAVPINAILLVVYASIWKYRTLNFIAISAIVWTTLTCIFITGILLGGSAEKLWFVFLIGVPLQIMEIFWASLRILVKKGLGKIKKGRKASKEDK
ncbi:MAG: helix-turn-helix transcriptional regulator [Clostridia bacterium]|nr:helix-turn-helix transcriptional regulator [Clostridia bacterium]